MLNDAVRVAMQKSVLCWLATVDQDGFPNVSPKEIFCAADDTTFLIANIASPLSATNVRTKPAVCISFVDPFVQKGFKLKGKAKLISRGDTEFEHWAAPLRERAGPRYPFASLFRVAVTSIHPIVAPSYKLYPDTTEEAQVESAMRAYGLRRLNVEEASSGETSASQ